MAVRFVAAGSFAGNATVATQAIVSPACSVGDILICAIINKAAVANVVTPPDGTWTAVIATEVNDCTTAADDHQYSLFWKRATASGASFTFTKATDDNVLFGGVIVAYSGALLTGSPLDATAAVRTETVGGNDLVSFPAYDPVATDVRVIFVAYYGNDLTTFAAAMSNDVNPDCTIDVDVESSTGTDCSIAITSGLNNGANVAARTWSSGATTTAGNTGVVFALVADPGTVWMPPIEQPLFRRFLISASGQRNNSGRTAATGFFRSITFDQPASDLTNFPVLISGTYSYLNLVAFGGKVENASGYDIAFYSDAGLTNLLPFERVYWDGTSGQVEFWVKVPILTSASALVIYMAYGNTAIITDQQDAAGTWNSNFKGVWHLPNGTVLTANDSKGVNNGTLVNSPTADPASQFIGGAANFASASSQYITMGNVIDFTTGDFTIEFWYKSSSGASGYLLAKRASIPAACYIVYFNGGGNITLYLETNGSNWKQIIDTNTNTADGGWHHFVGIRSGASNPTLTITIDGVDASWTSQGSGTVGSVTNSGDLTFSSLTSLYNGSLDEVRILDIEISADWIAAEYSNQNDPANFYTIGSETPV